MTVSRPRIIYLVTEDWMVVAHRLPIMRAARDAGYEVVVATRVAAHGTVIEQEGFTLVSLPWSRSTLNPFSVMATVMQLATLYRQMKPAIVHHVAIKPALLGSLAAWLAGIDKAVNAITGLGFVFTSTSLRAQLLKPIIKLGFRLLLGRANNRIIVENPDDGNVLKRECGIEPDRVILILGSGVDIDHFQAIPESNSRPVRATLASRMIWDKGIGDMVEAARKLKAMAVPVTVILAGKPDSDNPAAIPEAQLRAWNDEGVVEWRGHVADMPQLWAESHIAALPSFYGEGVPMCLIEAAACGRPIVAADGPGLREITRDGENGLLVPAHNPDAIADAIARLVADPAMRVRMGEAGRHLVESSFSHRQVAAETLNIYQTLARSTQA